MSRNSKPGYSPEKKGYVPKPAPQNVRPPRGQSGAVTPNNGQKPPAGNPVPEE